MTETRSTVVRRLATEQRPVVRILLIDPKPQRRAILKGFLRNLSIVQSVYERATAAELTRSLAETPVHLVILDQELGAETGLSVVRSIQTSDLQRKPRFMLISGSPSEPERREALELGVRSVLVRPFDVNTLERLVLESLGATRDDIEVVRTRVEQLRRLPAFSEFTDIELARLLKRCALTKIPAGELVYTPGQAARSAYVLVSGQVQLFQAEMPVRVLGMLQQGDCFGETSLVSSSKRRTGAQATTDAWVLEVGHSVFCKDDDPAALKLVRQIAIQVLWKVHALA